MSETLPEDMIPEAVKALSDEECIAGLMALRAEWATQQMFPDLSSSLAKRKNDAAVIIYRAELLRRLAQRPAELPDVG